MRKPRVTNGFVSFTEVEPGHHATYNAWHLFDHMPEQFPLAGLVFGQRWVLTPALRRSARAEPPLDRTHYFTLYLMAEPIEQTLHEFRDLAVALRDKNRFHEHRTSHLAGPLEVSDASAAPAALVGADAVPYRPNRGAHVWLTQTAVPLDEVCAIEGVAGAWAFAPSELSPPELQPMTMTVAWLDGDPTDAATVLADVVETARFSATLAAIDPWSRWDWFD
ncbi:MAG: hypothetical protein QOJ00_167 [Actinomycetota bacterium]|jgi:hypothetical protein